MARTATGHYVVMLRPNGSGCGCMGPYASAAVAKQEAEALPRANPRGTTCVVVRANSMAEATRTATSAGATTTPRVRANRGVEALPVRLPRSTQVQTLLFDSSLFNVGQAKSWAKRHGFRYGSVDTGGARASFIRLRQIDPAQITEGSFRTIRFTDGIEAVIGMPKRGAKRRKNGGPGAVRLNSTQLAAAALAPELVAAHAAAGLAARGVKAAGRGVGAVLSEAGSAFADIVGPRKRKNGWAYEADLYDRLNSFLPRGTVLEFRGSRESARRYVMDQLQRTFTRVDQSALGRVMQDVDFAPMQDAQGSLVEIFRR